MPGHEGGRKNAPKNLYEKRQGELKGLSDDELRSRLPGDMTREKLLQRGPFHHFYLELVSRPRTDGVAEGTLLDQYFPHKKNYRVMTDEALLERVPPDNVLLGARSISQLRLLVGPNLYEELAVRGLHTVVLDKAKNIT